jgi:hypothetical protein
MRYTGLLRFKHLGVNMAKKPSKRKIAEVEQEVAEIEEVEKLEAPAEVKVIEVEEEPVEVIDGTHERAELIRSFFPQVADVFSEDFDESNPDHIVIAAFVAGRRGMLHRWG